MDFRLRPGERMIRYFRPAHEGLYYLPWSYDGSGWREFPQEFAQYKIRTADGPRSQKDHRQWATGRIEYEPPRSFAPSFTIDMPSPYVIIDASFTMTADLAAGQTLTVATSTDGGRTWTVEAVYRFLRP
jgi:hypothetical protein